MTTLADRLRHLKQRVLNTNVKEPGRGFRARELLDRYNASYDLELSWSEAIARYTDANELYGYLNHYFRYRCPAIIREHRRRP